jgi:transcriptional regulator with GAF, ATPase, and Fis domain
MVDSEFNALCKDILDEGLDIFDLHLGIVSKIDQSAYLVFVVMPEGSVFQAGEMFDLKNTYCRDVVSKKVTIALTEFDHVRGLCKHPLYSGLTLESYIGTPIIVNDKVWGTLNFSSMKIRENDFSSDEIILIEERAETIAEYIGAHS